VNCQVTQVDWLHGLKDTHTVDLVVVLLFLLVEAGIKCWLNTVHNHNVLIGSFTIDYWFIFNWVTVIFFIVTLFKNNTAHLIVEKGSKPNWEEYSQILILPVSDVQQNQPHYHMFWGCHKLSGFWEFIFQCFSDIYDTVIDPSPLTALFWSTAHWCQESIGHLLIQLF
jgi:hypothetical protein